jgi:hypothetical protein
MGEKKRKMEVDVPVRSAKPFKLGENVTHGFYARRVDKQAVRAVIAENIHGMQQEIACLRTLMRFLLDRDGDQTRVMEAYSQAAQRLSSLVSARGQTHTHKQDITAEEVLSRLDEYEIANGRPPISPVIRQAALGCSSPGDEAFGLVNEEIATIRLLLRKVYGKACQGVDMGELLHLLNLYGLGSVRLARLLKLAGTDSSARLERYLQEGVDEAIRQVHQELVGNQNNKVDQ